MNSKVIGAMLIIGILFIITSVLAFTDMLFEPNTEIVPMIGWLGIFGTTLVTGILTTLQKESSAYDYPLRRLRLRV